MAHGGTCEVSQLIHVEKNKDWDEFVDNDAKTVSSERIFVKNCFDRLAHYISPTIAVGGKRNTDEVDVAPTLPHRPQPLQTVNIPS